MSELPRPVHQGFVDIDDCRLAYVERGSNQADKPTLFFVHATGFHSRVWDYLIEALPEYHIIALDQRGHGRSDKQTVRNWQRFAQDQIAVTQALGIERAIGIGHSMGGHGLLQAAHLSGAFTRLLLLDPTVSAPEAYAGHDPAVFEGELHPAAKRRSRFASAAEMQTQLQGKSSFPLFHPRIFKDYCEFGVEADEAGGVRLCCDPVVEAHVYMSARSNPGVLDAARELSIPVTIVRAKAPSADNPYDFSSSPTWPGLVDLLPHAQEHHWPECTHFVPMQKPDEVIALIRQEIANWQA